MKKEFTLTDEWLAYELRPDMPFEGMLMSKLFPGADLKKRYESLTQAGSPYGVAFSALSRASNSHIALEASEYARAQGHFHSFHNRVFRAYFVDTRDIGDVELILELARQEGLDSDDLRQSLKEKRFAKVLEEAKQQARRWQVTAVPTFIIDDKYRIVGAQPIDVFREKFRTIQSECRREPGEQISCHKA